MRRRWLLAVAIYVVFHLALVAGFRALVSRAQEADAAEAKATARATKEPPSKQVEFIRIGVLPRGAPSPTPAPARFTAAGPAAPAPSTEADAPPVAGPLEAAPGEVEPPDAVALEAAGPPEPVVRGPSDELIALVQERLRQGAERCYPAAAQRYRQQGVVRVSFCATASGAVDRISVGATSGSALLDHAATDCVVQSANPLPLEAAGSCFRLPVKFGSP